MSNVAPTNPTGQSPMSSITSPTNQTPGNPKKKTKWGYVIGGVILLLLLVGGGAGYWLTQQSQDIRQQATDDIHQGQATCKASGGRPKKNSNGVWYCDMSDIGGGDPCYSNGGNCGGDSGILRCNCGDYWVGVIGDSCAGACGDSSSGGTSGGSSGGGSSSSTPTPTPSTSPSPSPTPTPSPTLTPSTSPSPTPTPTPSASPTSTPSPTPTPTPTPSTSTTYSCNSSCSTNAQCQTANSNYICFEGQCRLDSNPGSDQCLSSISTTSQPNLPSELPESGSEDVINWLKAGLGVLGIGTVLLLLL